MLSVRDLSLEVNGRELLTDTTFTVDRGEKVGLVGRNGIGKTTLLRAIAGDGVLRRGEVKVSGDLGYLPQQPRLVDEGGAPTGLRHVLSGRGLDHAGELASKTKGGEMDSSK